MTARLTLNRRELLKTSVAGAALGLASASFPISRALAASATVGFIYVGPKDDYGYNQAHAEGAASLKSIEGISIVEEENVPETVDVQKTMESMINLDGASLIFPTSFGYFDPHMLAMCAKFPGVQFRHCGGMWNKDKHPMNAGSYFGYIGMGQYLNGVVAGHTSKSRKLGFVAAKPIPQVLLNINSFLLGARSVDPTITCQVIFTGEWSLAVKEAEATNALVDQGADVITCHVDSPKVVVETAAGRGAFVCGYHANQSPLAPEIPHRRRVELGEGLQDVRRRPHRRHAAAQFHPRRTGRRLRQDESARSRCRRGGPQAIRRHPGRNDEGRLLRHQGPAEEQQGRRRRDRRPGLRRDRHRARKHGLSRRGRCRLDRLTRTEAAT